MYMSINTKLLINKIGGVKNRSLAAENIDLNMNRIAKIRDQFQVPA